MTTPPPPGPQNEPNGAEDPFAETQQAPSPGAPQQPAPQQPTGQPPGTPYPPIAPAPGQPYSGQQYPNQPYGNAQYGAQQQFPPGQPYQPMPGAPYQTFPGADAPPKPKSKLPLYLGIGAIVVLIIAVVGAVLLGKFIGNEAKDAASTSASSTAPSPSAGNDGATPVGSCVTVSGSSMNVTTTPTSCDPSSAVSYIVGAETTDRSACDAGKYPYSVSTYGGVGGSSVICLVPNYLVDACYEESSIGIGIDLKKVDCSLTSSATTIRYRVTERTDSKSVPNCSDGEKQKVFAYDIKTSTPRAVGFCAEILGDYSWK